MLIDTPERHIMTHRPAHNGVRPPLRRAGRVTSVVALTLAATLVATAASAVTGVVDTHGAPLTLRATASTSGTVLASIPEGTALTILCKTNGTSVTGVFGTTSTWDRVSHGGRTGYVSAAYLSNGTSTSIKNCDGSATGVVRTTTGVPLTMRTSASASAGVAGSVPHGTTVRLECRTTGTSVSGTQGTTSVWNRVSYGGRTGYISGAYVTNHSLPDVCGSTPPPATSLQNPHPGAYGANGGWTPRAAWLRDQIKARFGSDCTTYATSSGEHANGNGLDCWGSLSTRRALATWAQQNARPLEVYYVIHEQRIWSLPRAGEGWRWMADRGSPTQNHYDHVHISMQYPGYEY